MTVFIIAEAGSSHGNDLQKAYRLIEAAKACGADAVKFQWTSSGMKMACRRFHGADGEEKAAVMYDKYLAKPVSWLESLKAHCDSVGIEFACTVYIPEDIPTVAPLLKRFKISAFESKWAGEFEPYIPYGKQIIASTNGGHSLHTLGRVSWLHCISDYPTKLDDVRLDTIRHNCNYSGFSDHTGHVLTGAAAVAAGARIVEAHIRLTDTSSSNPDFPHSLDAEGGSLVLIKNSPFGEYVQNIRTVERML